MKKNLSSRRAKRHSAKRAHAELTRRRTRPNRSFALSLEFKGTQRLPAPVDFDIMRNSAATLNFFEKLRSLANSRFKVFLDMSKVQSLAPDAILYLIATLEEINRSIPSHIEGNAPQVDWCARLLADSGFYDHVRTDNFRRNQLETNILSVRRGLVVEPEQADALKQFALFHIGRLRVNDGYSKGVYATLIECMANTKNHANTSRINSCRWSMLAAKFVTGDGVARVRFAFLDSGLGIPKTVKEKLTDFVRNDADLIEIAVKRGDRTQTGFGWRGKGLPKILSFQRENIIENLSIMSRSGIVDFSRDEKRTMLTPFRGTLLTWDFV